MSITLPKWPAAEPRIVGPYIDAVVVLIAQPLQDTLGQLLCRKLRKVAPNYFYKWTKAQHYRWRLVFPQPSPEVLSLLALLYNRSKLPYPKTQLVELAVDATFDSSRDAEAYSAALRARLSQRWRTGHGFERMGITYLKRRKWGSAQGKVYSDLPCRIDGRPCAHTEVIVRGASALKRLGLATPRDVSQAPRSRLTEISNHYLVLHDFAPGAAEKLGRLACKRGILRKRGRSYGTLGRVLLCQAVGDPVAALWVQGFMDYCKRQGIVHGRYLQRLGPLVTTSNAMTTQRHTQPSALIKRPISNAA